MTASPIAKLVVGILGAISLIVVCGAVAGDLLARPLSTETMMLGTTAIGAVAGVLAKTAYDRVTNEPQQVEVIDQPLLTEDVDPA